MLSIAFTFVFFGVFACTFVCGMSGMGFTSQAGWPSSGVSHVRIWDIGAAWNQIHQGPGVYDFGVLDNVVNQALSVGAKITYVIGATPRWLAKYPDQPYYAAWLGPGSNSMPYDVNEFNNFCSVLAQRYKGRILYYEIWNEPQLADFLYPYETAELNTLATMTSRAYSTIKAIDSSVMILAASVLPRQSSGGMSKATKYLDAIKAKGWNVDAFTTHIYPEVGKVASDWHNMLVDAKNSILSYSPPTSKLWVTETTYNLLGSVIPESSAASLVNSTYSYASNEGVQQIYWYAWDRPDLGGLQINSGSAAWAAIRSHA